MKKFFIITILLLVSCKKNDCDGYACFTPPINFIFELVDTSTGVNLFTNETLNSNEITFITSTKNTVEYTFIAKNNLSLIQTSEIYCNMGLNTYKLIVDFVEIDLLTDIKDRNENYCTYFKTVNFEITNTTEITKIKIG